MSDGGGEFSEMTNTKSRTLLHLAALTVFSVCVFVFTLYERRPWFGEFSTQSYSHHWLTGSTLIWSRNWYREGVWNLGFGLLDNPRSVEFPDMLSRAPYVSYPPGSTLPIWLLSALSATEPNLQMIQGYNLANQLAIAVCLGMIGYVVSLYAGLPAAQALLLGNTTSAVYLLLPATMYFHLAVYAMDTAALLPFALCLLIECCRDTFKLEPRLRAVLACSQWSLFVLGYLTDWLFVPVGVVFFAKRLFVNTLSWRGFLSFWSPAMVAATIFASQVTFLQYWTSLFARFQTRAELDQGGSIASSLLQFSSHYFHWRIPWAFGDHSQWILGAATLSTLALMVPAARLDRRLAYPCVMAGLALLPCMLQLSMLRQHSGHAFSVLKLAIPLALIPFSLLPAIVLGMLRAQSSVRLLASGLLATTLILAIYLLRCHSEFRDARFLGGTPSESLLVELQREFREQRIAVRDVVISPNFEIPIHPPQMLALTMKRVYQCRSDADIVALTDAIPVPYRLVFLHVEGEQFRWQFFEIKSLEDRDASIDVWRSRSEQLWAVTIDG